MQTIKKTVLRAGAMILPLLPVVALAQGATFNEGGNFSRYIGQVTDFINTVLIPLVFALALIVFIWGMFKFFIYNTEEEKEKGKDLAIWAVVAFVLMVSIWGIVNLIAGGLGFSGETIRELPDVPRR